MDIDEQTLNAAHILFQNLENTQPTEELVNAVLYFIINYDFDIEELWPDLAEHCSIRLKELYADDLFGLDL